MLVKGTNNKALAKMFFCVCTKFNIVCTTCQNKKIRTNLFIGKIRCLMHLTHKAHIKFEVNEMSNHMVL